MAHQIKFTVGGIHYCINSDDDEAYVKSIANELEQKMDILAKKSPFLSTTMVAVLAALEENGVIYSIAGKGSFLSQSDAAQQALVLNAIDSFKEIVQKAKSIGISEKELISVLDEIYIGGK